MDNLEGLYFDWLCSFVYNDRYFKRLSYKRLLEYLDLREFYYILPMDYPRAEDGVSLRYRFGREKNIDEREIANVLDVRPCSILEMMIALSIRIEESIMCDPDVGDRTGQWFWEMIISLGLGGQNDSSFDIYRVNTILYNFLERKYSSDGRGGLFTLSDPDRDQRTVEIWYQMQRHLGEVI